MIYSALLATVHGWWRVEWGAGPTRRRLRASARRCRSGRRFPRTRLERLRIWEQHYKLVILSNVHRAGFAASNRRLGVAFDAIYTAQDIGSYKPNPANFQYMLERLAETGVRKGDILHTAQSLFHDHAPAKKFGLASAWIDRRHDQRGWGATMPVPEGAAYKFSVFPRCRRWRTRIAVRAAPRNA